jgi:ribose 5-phosphate isomerase B
MDETTVRHMVRRVVYRTLGLPQSSGAVNTRPLITEAEVRDLAPGAQLDVPSGALITPLARQIALEKGVSLARAGTAPSSKEATSPSPGPAGAKTVAIGTDHGGYQLKEMLKGYLGELGYTVVDCGTDSASSVDYPDFAFAVAQLVAQGRAWRGIVVDGAGIGSCMAANKVPGVRAAMCYDQSSASNSREHNGANVLTLGAGLIGPNLARQIVHTWLNTPFGGGRHGKRVDKIMEIERRFSKDNIGK